MGSRPANALTLEEIQARENIQSSQPQVTDHDQSAFNKLVAVLQSSGAIHEQKPQKVREPGLFVRCGDESGAHQTCEPMGSL